MNDWIKLQTTIRMFAFTNKTNKTQKNEENRSFSYCLISMACWPAGVAATS